jgi:hypothetical protein
VGGEAKLAGLRSCLFPTLYNANLRSDKFECTYILGLQQDFKSILSFSKENIVPVSYVSGNELNEIKFKFAKIVHTLMSIQYLAG